MLTTLINFSTQQVNMGDAVDQEGLAESVGFEKGSTVTDSFRDLEKTFQAVTQPFQSSPEMKGQNGKYNLRKSLAWDSAFFTSAGSHTQQLPAETVASFFGCVIGSVPLCLLSLGICLWNPRRARP